MKNNREANRNVVPKKIKKILPFPMSNAFSLTLYINNRFQLS